MPLTPAGRNAADNSVLVKPEARLSEQVSLQTPVSWLTGGIQSLMI